MLHPYIALAMLAHLDLLGLDGCQEEKGVTASNVPLPSVVSDTSEPIHKDEEKERLRIDETLLGALQAGEPFCVPETPNFAIRGGDRFRNLINDFVVEA